MYIFINTAYDNSKEKIHEIFRVKLNLNHSYGANLDALYDVLSTCYSEPVNIKIFNPDTDNLKLYMYLEKLFKMLKDVCEENENVTMDVYSSYESLIEAEPDAVIDGLVDTDRIGTD